MTRLPHTFRERLQQIVDVLLIVMSLSFLVWWSTGRAGANTITVHPACIVDENKILNAPCEVGGGIAAIGALPCLTRMEAAMRAIDPYLVGPVDRATRQGWEKVLEQWEMVKAACWRTP